MSAKPAERLEKTLARVAREHGLDQERLRRWVSFLVLGGVLERARLGNRAVLKDFSRAEIFD